MNYKKISRTDIANIFFDSDQSAVTRLLQSGLEPDDIVNKTYNSKTVFDHIVKQKVDKAVSSVETKFNTKLETQKKTLNNKHKEVLKAKTTEITALKKEIDKLNKDINSIQTVLNEQIDELTLKLQAFTQGEKELSVNEKLDLKAKMIKIEKEFFSTFKIKEHILSNLDLFCNKSEMEEHFFKVLTVLKERIFNLKFSLGNVLKNRDSKFITEELDKEFKKVFNGIKATSFNPVKKNISLDDIFVEYLDDDMKEIKKKVDEYNV
jgi:hypothetical protein